MPISTRQNIINCAMKLFNKKGYEAVTLFEIAGELDISRGNLTYHFKDKNVLLEVIANEMWSQLEESRRHSRQLPSFENLHNEVQLYQRFQKEYAFIFLDNHVLNNATLKKKFKQMVQQTIKDNEAAIAFAIELGNMRPEVISGVYRNLALSVWMIAFYWLSQKSVRGATKSKVDAEHVIWSLLLPHFTDKGINSFKEFFGDDYLNSLGQTFDSSLEKYINF